MNKLSTKHLRNIKAKNGSSPLSMLTCYDYQTAQMLNESSLDLLLVGDSLGNVILGYETTVEVTLNDMLTFGAAVKRGAKNKFVIVDLPFGTYSLVEDAIKNACTLFQKTKCEALKLEGAEDFHLEIIERLTKSGIPIMGHIGLTPQSVHELGGYYIHGKDKDSAFNLVEQAKSLEKAGCFSIVLECIASDTAKEITESINIPTIGIGSGNYVDGQVLVINDLFKLGKQMPPSFCSPIADLYLEKSKLVYEYIESVKNFEGENARPSIQ